ncbi:transposase, IS605 OrfB family [Halothece sp. PCC 7418]|nr:RNA-guided endonuclease TnpB family protein [Halothece sp. PCC 7418]AFZ45050.1 transposase, IS605 OrfB family [Halothece sp. PCC 7418]
MPIKGKSNQSETKQGKGYSTATPTSKGQLELPLFATVASPPTNKKTTYCDKKPTSSPSTPKQKLLKTSGLESTSSEKDCAPYWTDCCAEISSSLLLPVETDFSDSDLNSSNIWFSPTVGKSWFSNNLFTVQNQNLAPIFSPSFTSSVVECTDSESTLRRSNKIRIFLNSEQKQIVRHWFGVSRFVFNRTVEYLKQPETKANWKAIKGEILNSLPDWCSCVPYQIKSIAVKDACQAVSNAKKKCINGEGFNRVRFRSRKKPVQSCYIPKSAVKEKGIYHTKLGCLSYKEPLPETYGDCRLILAYNEYFLVIPQPVEVKATENQGRVVALDPGIRTFLTFFSESSYGWLGERANEKIQKLCFKLDRLVSKISKAKSKQKRRMKRAASRIRGKIKNLIAELHHKTARFLVDHFDVILLPTFETSQMSKKGKRRIRSKSVRQMLTLSHYRFKEFLKSKAYEYKKVILDVNEAYTSKTVSWTGEIIHNLGGAKTIRSKVDNRKMDRDLNGARGIFLRALVDTPWLSEHLNLCVAGDC